MKSRIVFTTMDSVNAFILFAVKNGLAYSINEYDAGEYTITVHGY